MNDTQGAPSQTYRSGCRHHMAPATSTTNTPSHKHVTFELSFLGSGSRGWRNSESHQLPFPSNFPARLLSPSHTSPLAPSSFLDPFVLESPLASQPPFPPSEKYPLSGPHLFPFPSVGPRPADSSLKTGSPRGQCPKWFWGSDRRWAWGKHFLNALPAPWPCPELMAFISPWRLSWNHSH